MRPVDAHRCTVGEGFPEHCTREGVYVTSWTNGDEGLLCVEHAAWVREHSDDLAVMQTTGRNRQPT